MGVPPPISDRTVESPIPDAAPAPPGPFSSGELRSELDRFRDELRAAGLRESTVHSYLMGSKLFIRWLAGEYAPGPGRTGAPGPGRTGAPRTGEPRR